MNELRQGLTVLFRRPELRTLAVCGALSASGFGALIALEPIFVRQVLGGGAERLGLIYSFGGIGSTVGALGIGYLRRVPRELLAAGCALALGGAGMAVYIGIGRWPAVIAPIMVLGLGFASYQALGQTIVQRHSGRSVVGRVTAARRGLDESVTLVGTLSGGVIAHAVGVRPTLLGGAGILVAGGAAMSILARRHRYAGVEPPGVEPPGVEPPGVEPPGVETAAPLTPIAPGGEP